MLAPAIVQCECRPSAAPWHLAWCSGGPLRSGLPQDKQAGLRSRRLDAVPCTSSVKWAVCSSVALLRPIWGCTPASIKHKHASTAQQQEQLQCQRAVWQAAGGGYSPWLAPACSSTGGCLTGQHQSMECRHIWVHCCLQAQSSAWTCLQQQSELLLAFSGCDPSCPASARQSHGLLTSGGTLTPAGLDAPSCLCMQKLPSASDSRPAHVLAADAECLLTLQARLPPAASERPGR